MTADGAGQDGTANLAAMTSAGKTRVLVETFLDRLEHRDWEGFAAVLHPDVVYQIPQSRERIRGRDRYVQFNREFPGDWHLTPRVVIADPDNAVALFGWRIGDVGDDAMAFFTFADGLIATVTDYWPEPYDPPPGREHLTEQIA